jgi:hypothetical protein
MTLPDFLRFDPVPLKARHDGWTPELQLRFIVALARGARPGEAAAIVGMSRQGAYELRRRPGGESFAAAWDAALRFARQVRIERASAAREAAARRSGASTSRRERRGEQTRQSRQNRQSRPEADGMCSLCRLRGRFVGFGRAV